MEFGQILETICGADSSGHAKAFTGMTLYEAAEGNADNLKVINQAVTNKAIVNLYTLGSIANLDLRFTSEDDVDFQKMVSMLAKYRELETKEDGKEYGVVITCQPVDYGDENNYSFECFAPVIHCVTAQSPKGQINTLRMAIWPDQINVYEAEGLSTADTDFAIESDIRRRDLQNKLVMDRRYELSHVKEAVDELASRR